MYICHVSSEVRSVFVQGMQTFGYFFTSFYCGAKTARLMLHSYTPDIAKTSGQELKPARSTDIPVLRWYLRTLFEVAFETRLVRSDDNAKRSRTCFVL